MSLAKKGLVMDIPNTKGMAAGIAIFLLSMCLGLSAMAEVPNSVEFTVRIPDHSPPNTAVSLTVRGSDGGYILGPEMMTEVEEGLWRYTTRDLTTTDEDELKYMYSRHKWRQSGAEELVPDQFFGRTVRLSSDGLVRVFDEVVNWRWLPLPGFEMPEVQSAANETAFKPRIDGREFQSGHSLVDFWWDFWTPLLPSTHKAMKDSNANWIRIAPVSDYSQLSPTPVITQVQRANTRAPGELEAHIRQAKADGLKVLLTPLVCCDFSPGEIRGFPKNEEWWSAWLQQFESYVMYYVDIATRLEVEAIAIRGDYPLLGVEQPSNFPEKLKGIYSRARNQFPGLWGRALGTGWQHGEFQSDLSPSPEDAIFLAEADFISLKLWAGPATSADTPQSEVNANLMDWERTVMRPIFDQYSKPVVLDEVAFPAIDGGLLGELNVDDPDAQLWNPNTDKYRLDLVEQAMGYEAVMNMVAQANYFIGMYPFQYWPDEFPLGEGYDVRGKPAEVVLSGWYSKANAQNSSESETTFDDMSATPSEIQVTEAYIGLLGRAPDPAGLAYWTAQLNAAVAAGQNATLALKKLTNDIALSPEWKNGLGANDVTTQAGADAVVQGMYQNLFERAATQADLDWWTPQLTGGSTTASEMALNLITAAKSNMAKPIDGNMMGYKREAATYYVQSVAQSTFTVTSAINAVKDVSDPASLATSKAVTDSLKRGVANASNIASQPAAEAERSEEGTSTQGAPTAIPSLPFYGSSLLGCLLAYIGLWNLKRASRFKASQLAASI